MADPTDAECPATAAYLAEARATLSSMMQDRAVSDPERLDFLVKLSWHEGDLINETMDRMRQTMTEAEIGQVCDRIGRPSKRKRRRW